METADNCRRAAREAVADVEPPQLHELVETVLDEASMVPGTLTVKSAAIVAAGTTGNGTEASGDPSTAPATNSGAGTSTSSNSLEGTSDALLTHAAGVQLIYEGLRLTRTLAHDEPWFESELNGTGDGESDGDLEILAADILVARGFYLLARTDAAGTAVRTVQSFGRDQTRRADLASTERNAENDSGTRSETDTPETGPETTPADPAAIDANLERDILELAVQTGAAAVGKSPPGPLFARANELASAVGTSFPSAEECLAGLDTTLSEQSSESLDEQSLEEHMTDRATSATDP